MPYLFDYYNVVGKAMTDSFSTRNGLARIINPLVDALNSAVRLPRFVIVIPDWDILRDMKLMRFGVSYMSGCSLNWLCQQMDTLFTARKQDLFDKRRGSVLDYEPLFVWVQIIQRPGRCDEMKVRGKFNIALNNTLLYYKNHYIVDIKVDQSLFDRGNNLLPQGKIQFWRMLDAKLKAFDEHKVDLRPVQYKPKQIMKVPQ